MLSVVMLSVIVLSVVMLSVGASRMLVSDFLILKYSTWVSSTLNLKITLSSNLFARTNALAYFPEVPV
jgi:hypothetical protein